MSKVEIEQKSYLEMLDKINAYDRAIEQCELIRCDLDNAYSWINGYKKENQQLHSIIKEVRDIVEPLIALEGIMTTKGLSKLLGILDKENKE